MLFSPDNNLKVFGEVTVTLTNRQQVTCPSLVQMTFTLNLYTSPQVVSKMLCAHGWFGWTDNQETICFRFRPLLVWRHIDCPTEHDLAICLNFGSHTV